MEGMPASPLQQRLSQDTLQTMPRPLWCYQWTAQLGHSHEPEGTRLTGAPSQSLSLFTSGACGMSRPAVQGSPSQAGLPGGPGAQPHRQVPAQPGLAFPGSLRPGPSKPGVTGPVGWLSKTTAQQTPHPSAPVCPASRPRGSQGLPDDRAPSWGLQGELPALQRALGRPPGARVVPGCPLCPQLGLWQ